MENLPESQTGRDKLKNFAQTYWPLFVGGMMVLAAVLLVIFSLPDPQEEIEEDVDVLIAQALASATPKPAFSAEAYEAILPSLVFIQTTQDQAPSRGSEDAGQIGRASCRERV